MITAKEEAERRRRVRNAWANIGTVAFALAVALLWVAIIAYLPSPPSRPANVHEVCEGHSMYGNYRCVEVVFK